MIDLQVLNELSRDLPSTKDPDRELDAAILLALGHQITWHQTRHTMESYPVVKWQAPHPYGGMTEPCPRLTEDIQAAIRLVRQMLPDFGYRLQTQLGGEHPVCTLHAPPEEPNASITDGRSWSKHYDGGGHTMPLAIMSALLNALTARRALPPSEKGDGHG